MSQASSEAQSQAWLRLAQTENVGSVTFRDLIRRYGGIGRPPRARAARWARAR